MMLFQERSTYPAIVSHFKVKMASGTDPNHSYPFHLRKITFISRGGFSGREGASAMTTEPFPLIIFNMTFLTDHSPLLKIP
jgi:hypothetical protein